MQVEQGLCLNHRYLLGICCKRMNVQLISPCLEVDIAERLQTVGFLLRELDKNAPALGKPSKVNIALAVKVGAHPLNLKIGHIIWAAVDRAADIG